MFFDIAIQLFLNLTRVIKFKVDMTTPDAKKVKPDKVLQAEIDHQLKVKK